MSKHKSLFKEDPPKAEEKPAEDKTAAEEKPAAEEEPEGKEEPAEDGKDSKEVPLIDENIFDGEADATEVEVGNLF